ncbi:T9SS type A sorting domain-containing protein [Chitinophagaceae bacterium MMS25-I14]
MKVTSTRAGMPMHIHEMKRRISDVAKRAAFVIALLSCSIAGNAATRTSVTSGDWNSGSTWFGGTVPSATDNVVISPFTTVTVSSNTTINSIVFSSTSSFTSTLSVSSGATLTVTTSISEQNDNNTDVNAALTGAGTINCASLSVSGTQNNLSGDATTIMTSSVANLNISGDLTVDGEDDGSDDNDGYFNLSSGTVTVGGSVFFARENSGCLTVLDMSSGSGSGTLILSGSTPFNNSGTDGTFTANGASATVNYSRGGAQTVKPVTYTNLTLSGSGIKTTSSVTVNGKLSLQGTATANNVITYGSSATLEYKGSAAQTSSNNEFPASSALHLIIDNGSGVTLNGAKTLTATGAGVLAFNAGMLNVGDNILQLASNSTTAITGITSSSYIVVGPSAGYLQRSSMTVGNTYIFPIGNAAHYLPVTLKPNGSTGNFQVKVFQGATKNGVYGGTAYTSKNGMVDAIWTITKNSGGAAEVTLQWDATLEGSSIAGKSGTAIGISHYNGTTWDLPQVSSSNTTTSAYYPGFSSFSPFGVGLAGSPLPIVLSYFKGSLENDHAMLNWETGNDDARAFTLEKSTDGKNFSTLSAIDANPAHEYSYADPVTVGVYYYRLKMEENNGNVTYSNIVTIKSEKKNMPVVKVYPNPATDWLQVSYPQLNESASAEIYDMQGRIIFRQVLDNNTSLTRINVSGLVNGMYILSLKGTGIDGKTTFFIRQ